MLKISKYHGCGNDFLLLRDQNFHQIQKSKMAQTLCERHTGIGADGMIFLSEDPLTMKIINSDGSGASMCGNGIRCFVKYAFDQKITDQYGFAVHTDDGIKYVHIHCVHPFSVSVNMGKASFTTAQAQIKNHMLSENYPLKIQNRLFFMTTVYMTTLHTVIFVDSNTSQYAMKYGKEIHEHALFPQKTNVNFVQIIDRSHITVATYERGAGLTSACGSGCCASVYVARIKGLVDNQVQVRLMKGDLLIQIDEADQLIMCGGAEKIADMYVDMKDFGQT